MIVLDASVLIAYLDGDDAHHGAAEAVLAAATDLGVNTLTLAEVLVAPERLGRLSTVQLALRALEIRELPCPASAAADLARLRVATRLKMPDCCVLLAAQDAGGEIASFDDRLIQGAMMLGIGVHGV